MWVRTYAVAIHLKYVLLVLLLAHLSSLLSCSFYLLDQRTISGVEVLEMTGKTA